MNCIFQDDKLDNEFFNIFDSDNHFEGLYIDDKVMNTLDKAMEQYDDAKLATKSGRNQCNKTYDNLNVDSYKDYEYLDQDIKSESLLKDNLVDINYVFEDPLDIDKESLTISASPTTKITSNSICKTDDTTNIVSKKNTRKKTKSRVKKHNNKVGRKSMRIKLRTNNLNISNCGHKTAGKMSKRRKPRSFGYSRWGREEDSQMFKTLRQICSCQNINIQDFLGDNAEMSENHEKVLNDLKAQVHWRKGIFAMLKRIQKLAKDQSLSIRQKLMLRRLVGKAEKNNTELVVKDIADMFPGKLISTLQSELNKLEHQL